MTLNSLHRSSKQQTKSQFRLIMPAEEYFKSIENLPGVLMQWSLVTLVKGNAVEDEGMDV